MRLTGEMKKIALESEEFFPDSLSEEVVLAGEVDTAGLFRIVRFLDDRCDGRSFRNVPPATPTARKLVTTAAERLERWTPASDPSGRPVAYPLTLRVQLPVQYIRAARSPKQENSVLFMDGDPDETFHKWLHPRIGELAVGRYHVIIWVEPDGSLGRIETIEAPTEKDGRKFERIIRAGKGKWTPRQSDGTPVRSSFEYRLNMHWNE